MTNRNLKIMKVFILLAGLFPLLFLSCTTSQINMEKNLLNKMKVIALFPFQSHIEVTDVVRSDCEKPFFILLKDLNYELLSRDTIGNILQSKGLTTNDYSTKDAMQIAQTMGADTILLGQIIENSEEKILVRDYENEPARVKKVLVFRLILRLISVTDSQIILTMENKYPETVKEIEDPDASLSKYRDEILEEMTDDLRSALK